jgi:hypothetical protein
VPIDSATGAEIAAGAYHSVKTVTKAVGRVVGPAADEVDEALRVYTAFRLRNVYRIVERAEAKQRATGREGDVPPRVAHRVVDDGSYCDDELMVEYLGGLLAGSRSPGGRDDRAATYCSLITSLSTIQIRGHYVLYREWAALLPGRGSTEMGKAEVREKAMLCAPTDAFVRLVDPEGNLGVEAAVHALAGLQRTGLIEDNWGVEARENSTVVRNAPFPHLVRAQPSIVGMELYGWAQGLPGLLASEFIAQAEPFDTNPPVPRLDGAYLPKLADVAGAGSAADGST